MKKIDVGVEKVLEYKEIIMQYIKVQEGLILQNKIVLLNQEVDILKSKLKEHDTGHIITAIQVLQNRIREIEESCEVVLDSSYPDGDGYWK